MRHRNPAQGLSAIRRSIAAATSVPMPGISSRPSPSGAAGLPRASLPSGAAVASHASEPPTSDTVAPPHAFASSGKFVVDSFRFTSSVAVASRRGGKHDIRGLDALELLDDRTRAVAKA